MICQRARELIHPCIDGELDARQAKELGQHLDQCNECDRAYRKQLTLRSTLNDNSLYYHSPDDLRNRISSSLQNETSPEMNDYAEVSTH